MFGGGRRPSNPACVSRIPLDEVIGPSVLARRTGQVLRSRNWGEPLRLSVTEQREGYGERDVRLGSVKSPGGLWRSKWHSVREAEERIGLDWVHSWLSRRKRS